MSVRLTVVEMVVSRVSLMAARLVDAMAGETVADWAGGQAVSTVEHSDASAAARLAGPWAVLRGMSTALMMVWMRGPMLEFPWVHLSGKTTVFGSVGL